MDRCIAGDTLADSASDTTERSVFLKGLDLRTVSDDFLGSVE